MNANDVEMAISAGLSASSSKVNVQTEDNVHFYATIISEDFSGQSQVARQRKVYSILGDKISSGEIHALSLKTYTEKEWEEVNA